MRLDGGIVIEYLGIPHEEDDGSAVGWISTDQTAVYHREKAGDLTE